jgi:hypothetical protein
MKKGRTFSCDFRKVDVTLEIIDGKEICPHTRNYACPNVIECSFYTNLFDFPLNRRVQIIHACSSV